jgi:hypothetical protein
MQQQIEKKFFGDRINGGLNADDADFLVGLNQYVNAENVRIGSTDKGVIGTVESIGGTLLKSIPQPSVTFTCIGSCADDENQLFCFFLYNIYTNDHKIMAYSAADDAVYTVLLSSQVTGGLGFNKYFPIHSISIVNGMLYWVDGLNNEPRKINIASAIKMNDATYDTDAQPYEAPLNFSEITIIKPPPQYCPNIVKSTDGGFTNNFIANESFQFAFQYVYYDNETSVVGGYSIASKLNGANATNNCIYCSMDSSEVIPNTVRIVNLVVRYGNGNIAKVVKSWDKEIASEAAEISDHNNFVTPLDYTFYNDVTGTPISKESVLKPFDSVPIWAQTICAARNRIFLGNTTEGYDTPETTSFSTTLQSTDISGVATITRPLIQIRMYIGVPGASNDFGYGGWFVYLDGSYGVTEGYYYVNGTEKTQIQAFSIQWQAIPTLDPPPTSTSLAGLTFYGETLFDVGVAIVALAPVGSTAEGFAAYGSSFQISISGLTSAIFEVWKSRSPYKGGVVFYDFAMRRCGVVTDDGCVFEIPTRNYAYSSAVTGVIWSLSNANPTAEIPVWAYYYAPVRTLNQKTRFFVSAFDKAAKYATKDNATGQYVFTNTIYSTQAVGIALNTASLVRAGLGYIYSEGDICILIDNANNVYELPVVGQQGNYVIVKAQDVGDLTNLKFVYELYSPYKTSEQEPFFEIGEIYAITAPGTDGRQYSVTSGVFRADAYALSRNFDADTYIAEAMSPNDLFYKRWDNDGGKPNFITKLGQVTKKQGISFSNTFIPNTAVNGLSTFDALDEAAVPEDCGAIQRLILTSKVQGEGTVMLAICSNQTNSIYLGETQIADSTGATQFFSASQGIIGTINTLKGSFGTANPESVTEYRGNVYWLDIRNGRYVQYSPNGLFPISNYKMTRFWKQFSDAYMSLTPQEMEAMGFRPFVFSIVDPYHNELLVTIPKTLALPPKGYLPDYPEIAYPFDIWDGNGKTIVYDLKMEPNRWIGSYSFAAENFISLNSKLYSFKYGQLYEHNQTTNYNEFYGVQYKSKIMFLANQEPQRPKSYNAISIEANDGTLLPTFTYMRSENPYVQASDLVDYSYRLLEGVLYATIMRNKIRPTFDGYATDALLTGEKMRANVLRVMIEFAVTTNPLELRFVNIMYVQSLGHTT